jgi:hypothetical protein
MKQKQILNDNKFIQMPKTMQKTVDPDYADNGFVRSQFDPYQQKVQYEVKSDSSIDEDESDEIANEDKQFAEEQPYVTATSIGHKEMLKQLPLEELAKRSDIMITSTLSMSIFPKDKRII